MIYSIFIESLTLNGNHGVFKEEGVLGNAFEFNLEVRTKLLESVTNDNLEEGVDYSKLVKIIEEENKQRSKLLEHLAQRIIDNIYSQFSQIETVKLKVSKLNAPLKSSMKAVAIEIEQ